MILSRHLFARVMRRGRIIGLMSLVAAPALVFLAAAGEVPDDELDILFVALLGTIGYVYAFAALVVSASVLREERDNGTLPYLYMRPIARTGLSVSSTLAGMAASLVFALGAWGLMALAGLSQGLSIESTLPGLVFLVAAGVGYAGVFVPLGYLFSRSILVGLGYLILWETILAGAVSGLAQFSVWRISLSMYSDLVPSINEEIGEALGGVTPGLYGGAAKIFGVLLVGMAVLTWALRRRDAL